jgi:hypothetical protein
MYNLEFSYRVEIISSIYLAFESSFFVTIFLGFNFVTKDYKRK